MVPFYLYDLIMKQMGLLLYQRKQLHPSLPQRYGICLRERQLTASGGHNRSLPGADGREQDRFPNICQAFCYFGYRTVPFSLLPGDNALAGYPLSASCLVSIFLESVIPLSVTFIVSRFACLTNQLYCVTVKIRKGTVGNRKG